jgi:hypothetical protein
VVAQCRGILLRRDLKTAFINSETDFIAPTLFAQLCRATGSSPLPTQDEDVDDDIHDDHDGSQNPLKVARLRKNCRGQGSEVLERCHEEGENAKTTDRSQLQNLLKHCRTRKGCKVRSLRDRLQPHAVRAEEVRPFRAPRAPEIACDLVSVDDVREC